MAIDPYSPCPCGSGKKVKFCCSALLDELNQIEQMMKGEQYQAALNYVEGLEGKQAPQACLLAIKLQLLRALKRAEESKTTAAAFLEHFPDNSIALAESAVQSAIGGEPAAATRELQRALAASGKQLYSQVYEAMSVVAQTLLQAGTDYARAEPCCNCSWRRPRTILSRPRCSRG